MDRARALPRSATGFVVSASSAPGKGATRQAPRPAEGLSRLPAPPYAAVVIGASTGGPRAVERLLAALPGDLPATVIVVQHMPAPFTRSFATRLDRQCPLPVKEAEPDDLLLPGRAFVAPGSYHLRVRAALPYPRVALDDGPPVNGVQPAVDVTLQDVARVWGPRTVAVILTGMGRDGAQGAVAVKAAGGTVVVQDQATSVIYGMPRAVVERGAADVVLPLDRIPEAILAALAGHPL